MACLFLVGMGLSPGDISRGALQVVARCSRVFCETYTSLIPGLEPASLADLFAIRVELLKREQVEDGSLIVDALSDGDVALLVPGDPMISTTHISLRVQAARAGHTSRVVHSSSILSAAIGESCLLATRFGRMGTISFLPSQQPYDVLRDNRARGLHTLFLLDVDFERGRHMSIGQALQFLLAIEEKRSLGLIGRNTLAVGLARVSSADQVVRAGRVRDLLELDFGPPPHCLIVPSKLHFAESDALEVLLGRPVRRSRGAEKIYKVRSNKIFIFQAP